MESTKDTHPCRRSPEESASILSRLTFWWMHPLFRIGYKRQLEEQDVYKVLDRYRAAVVGKHLDTEWQAEVERAEHRALMIKPGPSLETATATEGTGVFGRLRSAVQQCLAWMQGTRARHQQTAIRPRPSVFMALARAFGSEYLKTGFFIELQDACAILTPILIQKLLEFIQRTQSTVTGIERPPAWHGYGLALAMLGVSCVQAVSAQNWVRHALKTSIPARTALVELMFRKATRLSAGARHQFPDGKIVNLLSNDTFRIELVPFYLWYMVSIPIFLLVILGWLIHWLGPGPALLGVVVLLVANPLQGWAMARLGPWRSQISAVADRRVAWTHQILSAIAVIKLFAWEPGFQRRATDLRSQEVTLVRRLLLVRGLISATASATPVLASAASFVLYAALGHKLDATIIFPALAFFNSMRTQMTIWPIGVSILTDARVSAQRITEFLLADEIQPLPAPDPSCPWAIEIQDGCFYWDRVADHDDKASKSSCSSSPSSSSPDKTGQTFKTNDGNATTQDPVDTTSASSACSTTLDPLRHVVLQDIQLQIPRGALVAVIGAVGQGKSSLLRAMAGQMPIQSGRLVRGEPTSFAGQQPWLQQGTVRDNIMLRSRHWKQKVQNQNQEDEDDVDDEEEEARYRRILQACQLERDLAAWPLGDLTEIGERGVQLSGGQQARVSLARAMFFQPEKRKRKRKGKKKKNTRSGQDEEEQGEDGEEDGEARTTMILDDPLAAVDAHVGRRLWQDCILTELRGWTRIVATHQLQVLPEVDLIVWMRQGRIARVGSYRELMDDPADDGFRALVAEFQGREDHQDDVVTSGEDDQSAVRSSHELEEEEEETPGRDSDAAQQENKQRPSKTMAKQEEEEGGVQDQSAPGQKSDSETTEKPMGQEERKYGAIGLQAYRQFFHAVGHRLWGAVFGAYVAQQAASVMMNLWLSFWSSEKYPLTHWQYIGIYIGLVLGQLLFTYLASMLLAYAIAKTGEVLHRDALSSVLRARMAFFETTALGQILTRFSKDVDSLDNTLHGSMNDYLTVIFSLLGIVVLMLVLIPWMALALPILASLFYFISVYSRATTRELKRLDSVVRARLVGYQSASLAGIETLRAFEGPALQCCIGQSQAYQDRSNGPNYTMQYATRWAALYGILVGHIMTLVVSLVVVATSSSSSQRNPIDVGQVGLVLSYLIQVGSLLNWTLQRYAAMEMALNSAERLQDYLDALDHEDGPAASTTITTTAAVTAFSVPASEPPTNSGWIQHGHIVFSNVSMRYRPGLPWVLKGVSFEIQPGEKVGVVGRTGAGKSSLIRALFRLVDLEPLPELTGAPQQRDGPSPTPPEIVVDGRRIDRVRLTELRSQMAIIPQVPTLFEGSFRFNLDPLARFSESQLWRALEMADLKRHVQAQEGGLDALVAAQGENLSLGQRQLVCLARALLLQSKVVVLDEATANVDLATDTLIQKAIRVGFADSTVITIAHRLNTIIDFDRVLVLDHGRVVEWDTPHALLSRPGSHFGQLVDETGDQNAAMLRALARESQASHARLEAL